MLNVRFLPLPPRRLGDYVRVGAAQDDFYYTVTQSHADVVGPFIAGRVFMRGRLDFTGVCL